MNINEIKNWHKETVGQKVVDALIKNEFDAWGNRIAAMNFGPKKVIIVVSVDKVCKDEAAAFERLKTTAGPMNNMRLNTQNACTKIGTCVNCQVKNRICRTYSVMRKKPGMTDITVVVVGEHLGF